MSKVFGKNVFVCGPMPKSEGFDAEAALDAQKTIIDLGASAVLDLEKMFKFLTRCSREDFMLIILRELLSLESSTVAGHGQDYASKPLYDLLVTLPGWEGYAEARLEREIALSCGIECCDLADVE